MKFGERGRNRTCDPRIKSAMLYRLSYAPRTIASIRHCSTNCFKRKIRKILGAQLCLKRALDCYHAVYVSMTYSTQKADRDALLAMVGRNLDANFWASLPEFLGLPARSRELTLHLAKLPTDR